MKMNIAPFLIVGDDWKTANIYELAQTSPLYKWCLLAGIMFVVLIAESGETFE